MINSSPIPSPPPGLRRQWLDNDHFPMVTGTHELLSITKDRLNSVIAQAAQWGADQELQACCKWLECNYNYPQANPLRIARRPKPPIRKEQALEAVSRLCASVIHDDLKNDAAIVRRALEALPND